MFCDKYKIIFCSLDIKNSGDHRFCFDNKPSTVYGRKLYYSLVTHSGVRGNKWETYDRPTEKPLDVTVDRIKVSYKNIILQALC